LEIIEKGSNSGERRKSVDQEEEEMLFVDKEDGETDWETMQRIIDAGCKNIIEGGILLARITSSISRKRCKEMYLENEVEKRIKIEQKRNVRENKIKEGAMGGGALAKIKRDISENMEIMKHKTLFVNVSKGNNAKPSGDEERDEDEEDYVEVVDTEK